MATNKETDKGRVGRIGEDLACYFLETKGFEIIARNYRKKWGEIDAISRKDNAVHFVEVKTVSRENVESIKLESGGYRPEDNVHPWKLERMARTIQSYLTEEGIDDDWQIDVVTVYLDEKTKKAKIDYLPNIIA